MQVKIDTRGFVYIKRGIIWRPAECKQSPRAQESCRDNCPLLYEIENPERGNRIHFLCASSIRPIYDITEDERIRRKEKTGDLLSHSIKTIPNNVPLTDEENESIEQHGYVNYTC